MKSTNASTWPLSIFWNDLSIHHSNVCSVYHQPAYFYLVAQACNPNEHDLLVRHSSWSDLNCLALLAQIARSKELIAELLDVAWYLDPGYFVELVATQTCPLLAEAVDTWGILRTQCKSQWQIVGWGLTKGPQTQELCQRTGASQGESLPQNDKAWEHTTSREKRGLKDSVIGTRSLREKQVSRSEVKFSNLVWITERIN
jgi:hypothetical protein